MRQKCRDCSEWAVPGSKHCVAHREERRLIMQGRREEGERGPYACGLCGEEGHNARSCPKVSDRDAPKCSLCGSLRHPTEKCPRAKEAGRKCPYCGMTGHLSRACPQRGAPVQVCSNCGQTGHNVRRCPKVACESCGELGHRADACGVPERSRKRGR